VLLAHRPGYSSNKPGRVIAQITQQASAISRMLQNG
jgi:hypothetical protein